MKIVPPNFGHVEDGIFRCGSPDPCHYEFLSSLGLKTCILLTDTHDEAFVRWLQECGTNILCPLSPRSSVAAVDTSANMEGTGGIAVKPNVAAAAFRNAPNLPPSSKAPADDANNVDDAGGDGAARLSLMLSHPSGGEGTSGAAPPFEGWSGADNTNIAVGGAHALQAPVARNMQAGLRQDAHHERDEGSGGPRNTAAVDQSDLSLRNSAVARFLKESARDRYQCSAFSPVSTNNLSFTTLPPDNAYSQQSSGPSTLRGLMTLSEPVVVDILHVLVDPQNYPLLITCAKGRYRTGIVCGCLRKLQRWNLVSILEEYRRYAGDKSRADNEEFIELFDKDLVSLTLDGGRRPTILYHS